MDRFVVGWSAGRHVDRPCGGGKFRHGLLEKSLNYALTISSETIQECKCKCKTSAN